MATMQKERLRPLTIAEQRELKRITKASSERVDWVKRATAVLAVAGGQSFSAAARAARFRSPGAVTYLVRRCKVGAEGGVEALDVGGVDDGAGGGGR